jgi:hypothetical protein
MLKISHKTGLMHAQVTTWYLKGARQRVEHSIVGASPKFSPFTASIMQCDQRASIHLFLHQKTYTESISHHPEGEEVQRRTVEERPAPTGPKVLVTINAVDTGERRQIGAYEAHHLKITINVEPTKGAATAAGTADADAWYLDLPGLYCLNEGPRNSDMQLLGPMMTQSFGTHDHMVYSHLGIRPQGLLIEETATERSGGNVIVDKTELLDSSDQPLDESLFEIPSDFTQREPNRPAIQEIPGTSAQ